MSKEQVQCGIEHHAVLFALMAKHAIIRSGETGKQAVIDGVTIYGEERGARMAENALNSGADLSLKSNQIYGEWRPEYPDQMEFGRVRIQPSLVTYISKCGWCEAWKKHGLTEYGKYYCVTIDDAVYRGFREDNKCEALSIMSWGDQRCEFDWGEALTPEAAEAVDRSKKENGDRYMKDFNFHTAHLYHTMRRELEERLGTEGIRVTEQAVEEYKQLFGREYFDVLERA